MTNKIYVGNLPYNVRISELKAALNDAFSAYGEIENIFLVRDRKRGTLKGFGFVTFVNAKDANAALALDGQSLKGRNMRVCIAKSRADEEGESRGGCSFLQKIKGLFTRG